MAQVVERLDGGYMPRVAVFEGGRKALLAYSALDRLIDGLGEDQEWVVIRTEAIGGLLTKWGADTAALDLVVPPERRKILP